MTKSELSENVFRAGATVRVGRCGRSASSEHVYDQPNHGRADRDRNGIRVCRMAWISASRSGRAGSLKPATG
jgi:hypothetical protein